MKRSALFMLIPNPFNPATRIRFRVAGNGTVQLAVFDLVGRQIAVLASESFRPGMHETEWNASEFVSGIYLCRLTDGTHRQTIKMILIR